MKMFFMENGSTFLVLFTFLLVFIVWKLFGEPWWLYGELNKKLKGPPAHWFFGNLAQMSQDEGSLWRSLEWTSLYGKVQKFWVGPTRFQVGMVHPDPIKVLLRSSVNISKNKSYRFFYPWLGQGLLTSTGSYWKKQRRLLTPAFHFKILQGYVDITSEQVDIFNRKIAKVEGQYVDILPLIKALTLDILGCCAFGSNLHAQDTDSNEYLESITIANDYIVKRAISPWLWTNFVWNLTSIGKVCNKAIDTLHRCTEDIIKQRQKEYAEGKVESKKHKDFLNILIEAKDEQGNPMSFTEIREQVDTFMFEGHDTTAHGIAWTLYLLALHRDHQQLVQEEVDRVYGKRNAITHEDLKDLEYLLCVIYESHRLYPPVPFVSRCLDEPMEVEGVQLPKGLGVGVRIWSLHRSPELWSEPNSFKPERFRGSNPETKDSFQYVPFSAGPRNCIGQNFALNEERVVLSKILLNYDMEVDPNHKVEMVTRAILVPKNGIKIKFTPRKK